MNGNLTSPGVSYLEPNVVVLNGSSMVVWPWFLYGFLRKYENRIAPNLLVHHFPNIDYCVWTLPASWSDLNRSWVFDEIQNYKRQPIVNGYWSKAKSISLRIRLMNWGELGSSLMGQPPWNSPCRNKHDISVAVQPPPCQNPTLLVPPGNFGDSLVAGTQFFWLDVVIWDHHPVLGGQ